MQAASAYDAAARKIRGNSTNFNLHEKDFPDVLLKTAAKSALEQLDKSRTERNVWSDTAAPTAPDEGRHAKLLQELLAEKNGTVRPVICCMPCDHVCGHKDRPVRISALQCSAESAPCRQMYGFDVNIWDAFCACRDREARPNKVP